MTKYLPSAPKPLTRLCDRKKGVGWKLLRELLVDSEMERAWKSIANKIVNESEYELLWREIKWAFRLSRKPIKTRKEINDQYQNVAKKVRQFSKLVKNSNLDLRIWEYFPEEVMRININSWSDMDFDMQSARAYSLLEEWPTTLELLAEVEDKAKMCAEIAMTEKRPVIRQQSPERSGLIIFVKHIHAYLKKSTGNSLDAVTASIANVMFKSSLSNREVNQIVNRTS